MKTTICGSRFKPTLLKNLLVEQYNRQIRFLKQLTLKPILTKTQHQKSSNFPSFSFQRLIFVVSAIAFVVPVNATSPGHPDRISWAFPESNYPEIVLADKRTVEAIKLPLCSGSNLFGVLMLPCRIGESRTRLERENHDEEEGREEEEAGEGENGGGENDGGGGGGLPRVAQLMAPARDLGWMPMAKRSRNFRRGSRLTTLKNMLRRMQSKSGNT